MKSTKRKVILSTCLAAFFGCIALVSGILLALNLNKNANSNASNLASTDPDTLTTPAKLKLTSDVTSVTPGGTFKVTATFSAPSAVIWYAMQTTIAPLTTDGTAVDFTVAQYLSLESFKTPVQLAAEQGDWSMPFSTYSPTVIDRLSSYDSTSKQKETGIFFMLSKGVTGVMSTNTDCSFELTFKLSESTPIDTLENLTFGLSPAYTNNFITVIPSESQASNQTDYRSQESKYASNLLEFSTREANTEAEIDSIQIDVDIKDTEGNPDVQTFTIQSADFVSGLYELTLPDTDDLDLKVYYPTMKAGSEGATVKAGATTSQTIAPGVPTVLTEDGVDITVSGTNRYLYIQAIPEDGNTANVKIYTVKLTFTYARLSDLKADSTGFSDSSITKCHLNLGDSGVFDPDTFAYTAYVPEGTTSTEVSPTLATDYGISTVLTAVKDGNYTMLGGPNVSNQGTLYLQNISNGEKLSFRLTAQDGTTQKTYEITFEIVTTNTNIEEILVVGKTSGEEIPNNEDKASEENKDYYYYVGDDPAQAKITITTTDENAKIEIAPVTGGTTGEFAEYDPDTVYELGEYVIKVTASAGNTKEYTLVLDKFDGFKLDENSEFALVALKEETDDYGETVFYRRTYEELGWTHGVDDRHLDRYVLGEINAEEELTLNDLVNNFSLSQVAKICVYDKEGTLMYDGANGGIVSGYADELICTSWKIVYGSGASADVIYVSVLCDVNGDGEITSLDTADINAYIVGNQGITFDETEVRLAAYVANNGDISTIDAANVNSIIAGNAGLSVENFLRKNAIS